PPTTTTTVPPTTTTSTTTTIVPPTTTAPPPPTAVVASSGGVVVSPTGVVLPVVAAEGGGWRVTTPCGAETVITAGTHVTGVDIVIDPGHGGSESGAAGGGLVEKDLNLQVARQVEQILE